MAANKPAAIETQELLKRFGKTSPKTTRFPTNKMTAMLK